jgi:hypothetical protein
MYYGREEVLNSILREQYHGCDLNDPRVLRAQQAVHQKQHHAEQPIDPIQPLPRYREMHHIHAPELLPGIKHASDDPIFFWF